MREIKVLVVEDEIIIADNICDTLRELGFKTFEPAINYTEAIAIIESEKPDIAILDIQLAGKKTGIDLAEKINEDYKFPFMFLTSNADELTLNEAKKVMPPAYLIKPFSKDELYATIEIVYNNFLMHKQMLNANNQDEESAMFVKEAGAMVKFVFSEIRYLKSSHVYIEIMMINNKTHVIRGGLNDIIKKLNNKFIQVHRSYIVNVDFIEKIDTHSLSICNESIPIGKKYKTFIFKKLNIK